jgi:G patch domain-containing protein 1
MSDEEDDDYVTFGKHLKEIVEGETIRKRPISVEEQIVTDENGKRRFHGAFTGGFSAGFFNTVDTPQGWYPSQFKSSRSARQEGAAAATRQQQRPEDFMDAEDLGDFGFASQGLRTKANFQSKASGAGAAAAAGPVKSAAASSLLGERCFIFCKTVPVMVCSYPSTRR